ncbi:hypothetical protein [Nocardia sp. NPDC051832]|uniref:hypothetical protein n=1 Tax=Nocardia sp. NPDC051832 TaxID=3155673 RepID=UPI00342718B1
MLVIGLVAGGFLGSMLRIADDGKRRNDDVEHAELVLFQSAHDVPPGDAILRSVAEVTAYSGRFANYPDIRQELVQETLSRRNFDTEVLIAFTWGGSCSPGNGAKLTTSGGANYSARLTGAGDPPDECAAQWKYFAVFAIPVAEAPPQTTLGGLAPGRPGPARLMLLGQSLHSSSKEWGAEISQLDQLQRFLADVRMPPDTASSLTSEVLGRGRGLRAYGFALSGCRNDGAYLTISKDRLKAVLTGGERFACAQAEHYLAVFVVPAEFVPPSAKIG